MAADSTLDDVRPVADGPVPRWGRRLGLAALLIVVVLGAVGYLGVRSRTISANKDGYTLRITYPQMARAGLDVPWRAQVHHAGGLPKTLTIAVSTDYFRMFETQGFYPDAQSMTNDGTFVYFTFTTQPGDDFLVDYDAYIQPSSQIGKSATVELIVAKRVVVSATLHTWLMP
ncbi:MAG TPA: hypothetical protein VFE19_13755 [Jatrophihabitantaceae bacterium]|nr:hypothetical protein [Jatrophihabitantaceae bacterium]